MRLPRSGTESQTSETLHDAVEIKKRASSPVLILLPAFAKATAAESGVGQSSIEPLFNLLDFIQTVKIV